MKNMSTFLSPTAAKNEVCCKRFPSMSFKFNPSDANDSFLYPLKTPENLCFFVFSGGIKRDQ